MRNWIASTLLAVAMILVAHAIADYDGGVKLAVLALAGFLVGWAVEMITDGARQ